MENYQENESENPKHSITQRPLESNANPELQEQTYVKTPESATEQVATSLKTICSETQRIARKSCLLLPYHKPKQRGLHEFLNRKKTCIPERFDKSTLKGLSGASKVIADEIGESQNNTESDDVEKGKKCKFTGTSHVLEEIVETSSFRETGSPHSFVSDAMRLEFQGDAERRLHAVNESIATSSTTIKVTDRPKLYGHPGEVIELCEDSTAISLPANRIGIPSLLEGTCSKSALTHHSRKESNFEKTETRRNTDRLNIHRHQFKEALRNRISANRAAIRIRKQQELKSNDEMNEDVEEELEEELEEDQEEDQEEENVCFGIDADINALIGRKSNVPKKYYSEGKGDADSKGIVIEEPATDDGSFEEAKEQGLLCPIGPSFSQSGGETGDIGRIFRHGQESNDESFNDLLALCSGTFSGNGAHIVNNETSENSDNEHSYVGATNVRDISQDNDHPVVLPTVPSSDDDNTASSDLPPSVSRQILSTKRKKLLPLLLSDDEDDLSNDEETGNDGGGKDGEKRRLLTSDDVSDLDELEPTDFFDKEAELSGSEIGSDDEREDEENEWEIEEGDKEDIDEDEVREQVGRNHLKIMLDDDQREVRLFQELFLEDGDLHSDGGGRKKQFKWNASTQGFDNEPIQGENDAEDQDASEGTDETTWRKAKNEREKWLQQKGMSVMLDDLKLKTKNVRIVKTKATPKALQPETQGVNPETNCLPSSPTKNGAMLKVRRGSFLRRGEKELTEIANLSKAAQPVQAPTASSNFVFASVTPKRNTAHSEKRKVKVEDTGMEKIGTGAPPNKKSKIRGTSASLFSFL